MPVRYDHCKFCSMMLGSTAKWPIGPTVYKAIRKVHKYTPILIFGGMSSLLFRPRQLTLRPRTHTYP